MTGVAVVTRVACVLAVSGAIGLSVLPLLAATQEGTSPETPTSVSVRVFSNISGDTADDWIGVGLAETVSTGLESVSSLTVVRLSPLETGTVAMDVSEGLNTTWVVRGAYQRLGEQLRLTAEVTDVETGNVRHSATIDGRVEELFALQDRLVLQLRTAFESERNLPQREAVPRVTEVTDPVTPQPVLRESAGIEPSPPRTGVIDGPPPPEAPATINRDANGRATVRAVRLEGSWELDGVLDEEIYDNVQPIGGFIQQAPDEGAPASEQTDAWIFFDDRTFYVAARLWESVPESEWIANEMQRDSFQLINNDGFLVVLDTFYDRRNAFAFRVNPIGGFSDQQITDEQCCGNSDWNPVWDVRTGRFDGGWTVEMAIPFKSLRFRPGPSQLWGIQFGRDIRAHFEEAYLTPVAISAGPGQFRVSAGATLTGLEVPEGNRTIEIKPYVIGSLATDRNAIPAISNAGSGDFGVDFKYGLTENLTADFTYNTDFAQVEVDEQQINLTRFSLFFPEKREFFLEGQGIFDFGRAPGYDAMGSSRGSGSGPPGVAPPGDVPTLFFSRRIGLEQGQAVPILAGGRLNGKVGDFNVGALNIHTDEASNMGAVATNFTVLRIKRDVLRRSRIGGIFTGRSISQSGEGSNQAFGLDGSFSFYDNVNFFGYYAKTKTPNLTEDDESYQAAFSYDGDLYGFKLDHLLVGDNFNPEIGFLRRDDFRRTFVAAKYSPRPSAIEAVRQFTWGGSFDYIMDGAGQLQTRIAQGRFRADLENSDSFSADVQQSYEFLSRPFEIATDVTIPVGGYTFQDYMASYDMGPQRRFAGSLSIQKGAFFGGDITALGYTRGRINISPQFAFEPSVSVNRIELPEGHFTAKLVASRFTYAFNPRMFVVGLLQYNSTRDVLSTNVRLRWLYQPGSELFVVYNDQRDTQLAGRFPFLENRAFVVKLTRLFRF